MLLDDVGIVFFSGHGGNCNKGMFHLCPADLSPTDIAGTGVSHRDITRFCAHPETGKKVLLIDACYSGHVNPAGRYKGPDQLMRELDKEGSGVVAITSSRGEEKSWEDKEWGGGAFTKVLSEGLLGKADNYKDGIIFTHEAYGYLCDRVLHLVLEAKEHRQSPNMITGGALPIPLTQPERTQIGVP